MSQIADILGLQGIWFLLQVLTSAVVAQIAIGNS